MINKHNRKSGPRWDMGRDSSSPLEGAAITRLARLAVWPSGCPVRFLQVTFLLPCPVLWGQPTAPRPFSLQGPTQTPPLPRISLSLPPLVEGREVEAQRH